MKLLIQTYKPVLSVGGGILLLFFLLNSALLSAGAKSDRVNHKFKALRMIQLPGTPPPADDILLDMDGNTVKLSDFKGKIVFLNFWTTWCPDCIYEMPDIENLHNKFKNKDFLILAIDLKESKRKVEKFIDRHGLSFKVLLDQKGSMGRAFRIRSIPTTFILDKNGGLIGKAMGARDWDGTTSINLFKFLLEQD